MADGPSYRSGALPHALHSGGYFLGFPLVKANKVCVLSVRTALVSRALPIQRMDAKVQTRIAVTSEYQWGASSV